MTYFPNGTAHACYVERYCDRCANFRDQGDGRGYGCPITDLHFLWNYEALRDTAKREALDFFIPREDDEFGHKTLDGPCAMFLPENQTPSPQPTADGPPNPSSRDKAGGDP